MVEAMEEVRRRMVAMTHSLETKIREINLSVARDDGKTPREQALARQLTGLAASWKAFDVAHLTFVMHVNDPAEMDAAGLVHQNKFHDYELATEAAEDLIAKRQQDAEDLIARRQQDAREVAARDGAQAAAAGLVDAAQQKERDFNIAKAQRDDLFRRVTAIVTTARTYLDGNREQECRDSLEGEKRQLERAETLLMDTSAYTQIMVRCKPDDAEATITSESTKRVEATERIQECKDVLAEHLGKLMPVRPAAAPTGTGGVQHFFKKRELPKFEGELRDFPAFRHDWQDSVAGKFDQGEEVRCIKERVPREVEPDVKNLHTMDEIWKVLDNKYGNVMDLSRVLIAGLWNLTLPTSGSEPARFLVLHREWLKVYNDLKQIGQLSALDHDPTLCQVAEKLPSAEAKKNYSRLRISMRAANARERAEPGSEVAKISELKIMSTFMEEEKQLQDQYAQLCPDVKQVTTLNRDKVSRGGGKSTDTCFSCGKAGHISRNCPEEQGGCSSVGRQANANMRIKPKECPACNGQHISGTTPEGDSLWKTRLSACPTFMDQMQPAERASLVEEAKCCALCLDWTGSHQRDNCAETIRSKTTGMTRPFSTCPITTAGTPCGLKHNSLLHGSTIKYCNYLQVNRLTGGSRDTKAPTHKVQKVQTFPECEEGVDQPRDCGACPTYQECSELKLHISQVEETELHLPQEEELHISQDEDKELHISSEEEKELHVSQQEEEELHLIQEETYLETESKQAALHREPEIKELEEKVLTDKAVSLEPQMGHMPPFTTVSLDMMDPVDCKVNKRAHMKVYPMVFACQETGALHTEVAHEGSTAAFLLSYNHFTSSRGYPVKVFTGGGVQFTAAGNEVAFGDAKTWEQVEQECAKQGTAWEFAPARTQFGNGHCETRVQMVKRTLKQTLDSTIISSRPTLSYDELQSVMNQVANIVNDRPLHVEELREGEPIIPVTVNQLLLGQTSTTKVGDMPGVGDFKACSAFANNLLDSWWSKWKQQGFASLLPNPELKHAKRHQNLRIGDVCLLYYDNKVKGTYRLCVVLEVTTSREDIVRTVKVGFRPRRHCGPGPYKSLHLYEMDFAVQRLVLLVPREDAGEVVLARDGETEEEIEGK